MTRKGSVRSDTLLRFPHIQVPLALIYDSRLSPEEKVVLLALTARCLEHEYTVVAVERLAEELGMSERTVYRHLTALRKAGWIECIQRGDGKTSRKTLRSYTVQYHPAVLRYPYFFLRHDRTEKQVELLRSKIKTFDDSDKSFSSWLNGRVEELEGEVEGVLPNLTDPPAGKGAALTDLTGQTGFSPDRSVIQNRSRYIGTDQEKDAERPASSSGPSFSRDETATTSGSEYPESSAPLTTPVQADTVSPGGEEGHGESDRPVSPVDDRMQELHFAVEKAKERAKESNTRRLRRAMEKDQRRQNLEGSATPLSLRKSVSVIQNTWKEEMAAHFPDITFGPWAAKERKLCKDLVEKYSCQLTLTAIRYVIRRWGDIEERYFKRSGGFPSIGFLVRFHDTMFPEAQRWEKVAAIEEEWDRWFRENPGKRPPSDLRRKYQSLKEATG